MVDITAAKELLAYDPESGLFTWKVGRGGGVKPGTTAGSLDSKGYVQIKVNGRLVLAHRLAWAFTRGDWPAGHLDHIDRNPKNNAIANLRQCSHAENHQNVGLRVDSSSGVTGVSFIKKSSKWLAYVCVNQKRHRLGQFDTFDEAVRARIAAKAKLHQFHPFQAVEGA